MKLIGIKLNLSSISQPRCMGEDQGPGARWVVATDGRSSKWPDAGTALHGLRRFSHLIYPPHYSPSQSTCRWTRYIFFVFCAILCHLTSNPKLNRRRKALFLSGGAFEILKPELVMPKRQQPRMWAAVRIKGRSWGNLYIWLPT